MTKKKKKIRYKETHTYFDENQDGHLNYQELSKLQSCTSAQTLELTVYDQLCKQFGCEPEKGLSLHGLNLTYATEVANLGRYICLKLPRSTILF